jgi:hypothetical protein
MKVMTAGGAGSGGMKTVTTPGISRPVHDDDSANNNTNKDPFPAFATKKVEHSPDKPGPFGGLEIEYDHSQGGREEGEDGVEEIPLDDERAGRTAPPVPYSDDPRPLLKPSSNTAATTTDAAANIENAKNKSYHDLLWLMACFVGIMLSFVGYGLLLEYTTSGGRKLHELSFLFVTSALYTVTAAVGRYVRDETPSTIPPAQFALLGLTSMGSTFCSVRSLRYV